MSDRQQTLPENTKSLALQRKGDGMMERWLIE
jgi:hypothetical protein